MEEKTQDNTQLNNKNGIFQYLKIGFLIVLVAFAFIFLLGKVSEKITAYADNYYRNYFLNEEPGFSAPWYVKGLHKVDEAFIYNLSKDYNPHVFLIGSSVSSNSIDADTVSLNENYTYKALVCGNGCYRSNRIFINMGEKAGLFTDKDIIKYEVSFSTFRDSEKTITETVLDKWGKYSVNEDLTINENSLLKSPLYRINVELIKIQNVWEIFTSWWEQTNHPDRYPLPRGYANFKNNYFNYDAVADSCHFTEEYAESVLKDIDELNDKYVEVVEISPLPQGLLNTDYGQLVNEFIDNELIPHLDKKGIRYRDLRNAFEDREFADGVHLSYEAEVKYTNELNDYMNDVISEIN